MIPFDNRIPLKLSCRDVGWRYESSRSPNLSQINLDVLEGENVALLGLGGSGKTTLMLALCGQLAQRYPGKISGKATLGDADLLNEEPGVIARRVAFISSFGSSYFFSRCVSGELAFAHSFRQQSPLDIVRTVHHNVSRFSLSALLDRRHDQLSGGEKELVSIGSSFSPNTHVILCDVSGDGLDGPNRRRLFHALVDSCGHGHIALTSGLVLPDDFEVFSRVIVIDGGRLTYDEDLNAFILRARTDPVLSRFLPRRLLPSRAHQAAIQRRTYPTTLHTFESPPSSVASITTTIAPAIRADSLTVRHGNGTLALNHFSGDFGVAPWTGVVGRNGSGKSTLLRCVAGLQSPTSGRLIVLAKPVDSPALHADLRLSFMLQDSEFQLIRDDPISEIREVLASTRGVAASSVPERECVDCLEEFGMSAHVRTQTWLLPRHERRALVLAALLAREPQLLLLDEPTANLEPDRGLALLDACRRRCERIQCRVVIASHSLEVVQTMCNEVLTMHAGERRFFGSVRVFLQLEEALADSGLAASEAPSDL